MHDASLIRSARTAISRKPVLHWFSATQGARVANLTVTLEESTLRRARLRALEQGTSVNALVRDYLESFAGGDDARRGLERFLDLAEAGEAGSGPDGRSWTRDQVYDRAGVR